MTRSPPIGAAGKTPRRLKCDSKPPEAAFYAVFRDIFRPEVVSDVISAVAVEQVGLDIRVKFGDSRSNRLRDNRAVKLVMDERRTTITTPAYAIA